MRYVFCLTVCTIVFLSCKSDTAGTSGSHGVFGRTTIDSTTGYGFSFARGTPQPVPPFPTYDSVDDFNAGYIETRWDPTPIALCFRGYTEHMFHLVRQFSTYDSARSFFQSLAEVTDTSFLGTTCQGSDLEPMTRANQIWSVVTRQNKFAKMLIVIDTNLSNHLQVTFDWEYQPTGSRRF